LTNYTSIALRSVLNLGIGYQIYVSQAVALYGSVILDHNASDSRNRFDLSSSDMTIYHVTGGSNIKIGKSYLTAGIVFSYGNYPFRTGDLWQSLVAEREPGGTATGLRGSMRYFRVKAILSASFSLQ
jgi:hypothetical protein